VYANLSCALQAMVGVVEDAKLSIDCLGQPHSSSAVLLVSERKIVPQILSKFAFANEDIMRQYVLS
jgi:hypothetical protein